MSTPVVNTYTSPEKQKAVRQEAQLQPQQIRPDIDLSQVNPGDLPPEVIGPNPAESQTYLPSATREATPSREQVPRPATEPEAAPPTAEAKPLQQRPEAVLAPKSGEAAMVNPEIGSQGAAVTGQQVLSKIAGYQSTQAGVVSSFVDDPNFPANLLNFMQSGDPTSANLWQAILLIKWYKVLQAVLKGEN